MCEINKEKKAYVTTERWFILFCAGLFVTFCIRYTCEKNKIIIYLLWDWGDE